MASRGCFKSSRVLLSKYKSLPGGILFTPGPLTTTAAVKESARVDLGSRDDKFIQVVKDMRQTMLHVGNVGQSGTRYTMVPMQGSGSMGIESILGTTVPPQGKVLIIKNGAYGERMLKICQRLDISTVYLEFGENETPNLEVVAKAMQDSPDITNVAIVHCETTTGILNPIDKVSELKQQYLPNAFYFVDAMSSFGAVPVDIEGLKIDYLCTSSNKCVQGIPGFAVILANKDALEKTDGWARSFTLDLLQQFRGLEKSGQFNNTPPIQSILAFNTALEELAKEGWAEGRMKRYQANSNVIVNGLKKMGFKLYLEEGESFGWIILTFLAPEDPKWNFQEFYNRLNNEGFVIYPGKLTEKNCFRIGCIGDIHPEDSQALVECIQKTVADMGLKLQ